MGTKRKLKGGVIPQAKHRYSLRSKYKCYQFELENFCLRFPRLGDKIIDELNPQSMENCKRLSRFWQNQILESRIYWIRIIQSYTKNFNQYKDEWTIVTKKTPLKVLKKLTTALYIFKPGAFGNEFENKFEFGNWEQTQKHMQTLGMEPNDQWSPLHVAAKFGLDLFKDIASKFKNNLGSANNNGETPLHCATKTGHLEICKLIINNTADKNPPDNLGFTPLHYAAMLGYLEIYKFIYQNAESKNPTKIFGKSPFDLSISPFECAHYTGKKDMCKFIFDNFGFINKDEALIEHNNLKKFKVSVLYVRIIDQYTTPVLKYSYFLMKDKHPSAIDSESLQPLSVLHSGLKRD